MKHLLLVVLVMCTLAAPAAAQNAQVWKCPPCGQDCDALEFTAAGTCPHCNMSLILEGSQPRCAILIFDGVQIIDYTGPYEVFGQARFDVYTVAANMDTITTAMDMFVLPNYTIANAPAPDVIVVPGGHVEDVIRNEAVMNWLRHVSANADQVLSVCNGAFILASIGALDGLGATTFYGLLDELETTATQTKIDREARFVDNGKFITSAGLSSGIDASLHVIEKRSGRGAAQRLAIHLEYEWNPEPDRGFARGALALVQIERMPPLLRDLDTRLASTAGDRDRWKIESDVTSEITPEALHARMAERLGGSESWKRTGPTDSRTSSRWAMTSESGERWTALLGAAPGAAGAVRASIEVMRDTGDMSRR